MEDETSISLIMQALKKGKLFSLSLALILLNDLCNDLDQTNNVTAPSFTHETTNNMVPRPETGSHHRRPSRNEKVNSSLALNFSIHQTGDASFDMKGDIESLSKNIGNISMINNSKFIDNPNVSQIEMDDLILKMMLENPDKAKSFKEQPNAQNLNTSYQSGNSNVQNLSKKNSSQSTNENRIPEQGKATSESINPHHQRRGSYSKTQPMNDIVELAQKQLSRNNSFNKENNPVYENIDRKPQQLTRSNSAISRPGSVEPELYKHQESKQKHKCSCGAEEELARAKIKIESLEKKLKVLIEENKVI